MTDEPTTSDDAVCASTTDSSLLTDGDPELVYEPRVHERPGDRAQIVAKRENPEIFPWGFWGGVLVAGVVGFVLFSGAISGATIRFPLEHVLVVAVLLVAGLALYRLGRRSTLEERVLCHLDLREQILSWPLASDGSVVAVAFGDVEELTFALRKVPVSSTSSSKTRVEAATVRIVDARGRELPIVEASTSKGDTHLVARWLSDLFGVSVDYVGTGVEEWV